MKKIIQGNYYEEYEYNTHNWLTKINSNDTGVQIIRGFDCGMPTKEIKYFLNRNNQLIDLASTKTNVNSKTVKYKDLVDSNTEYTFYYDNFRRLKKVTLNNINIQEIQYYDDNYDIERSLLDYDVTNCDGYIIKNYFDKYGRIIKNKIIDTNRYNSKTYEYDYVKNKLYSIRYYVNDEFKNEAIYDYDEIGNLIRHLYNNNLTEYDYDNLKRIQNKQIKLGDTKIYQHYDYFIETEMTSYNVEQKDLQGERPITKEHAQNNTSVRNMLGQRGIKPEELPPAEDIKKLERRVKSHDKKIVKQSGQLPKP
jgi:hypothetical protein